MCSRWRARKPRSAVLKRSSATCAVCGEVFTGTADDDQHGANMRAEAALVIHLEAAHPIGAPPG